MNMNLNAGDLVMSATRGLGMINKIRPAIIDITWFDNGEIIDYQRSLVKDFRNLYFDYRKKHNL